MTRAANQRIEYIETTGTQYIDTGYTPEFYANVDTNTLHVRDVNTDAYIPVWGAADYYTQKQINELLTRVASDHGDASGTKLKAFDAKPFTPVQCYSVAAPKVTQEDLDSLFEGL